LNQPDREPERATDLVVNGLEMRVRYRGGHDEDDAFWQHGLGLDLAPEPRDLIGVSQRQLDRLATAPAVGVPLNDGRARASE
jgi:hypothetical protein